MLVTAVVTCLVSGVSAAQDKAADTMELLREKARESMTDATADQIALLSKDTTAHPHAAGGNPMKDFSRVVLSLVAAIVIAGCASTTVSDRQTLVTQKIPRPDQILIYDFVATPADVPADSALAGHSDVQPTPQTAEQIATGRRVGAEIGARLVEEIRDMGLPARRGSTGTTAQINDLVIRGYLLSVDEGSAAKRVAIGFGAGASHLSVAVEGYQMTAQGLRKLGSGTLDAGGGKGPGAAAPLALAIVTGNPLGLIVSSGMKVYGEASGSSKVEGRAEQTAKKIAEELEPKFRQQGWIR